MRKLIETSFLIPSHEDKDAGNGQLHPISRWNSLLSGLLLDFGGWTLDRGLFQGCYPDPDCGEPVFDASRKVFVAVKKKDLKRLRRFLKRVTIDFRQKEIYFCITGKVEFIRGDDK